MQVPTSRKLLLISTSTVFGTGYLDHAEAEIREHLAGISRVLFVPYALQDHDAYTAKARERFLRMGFELESVHASRDPKAAVAQAQAIFIGGGNTFRLLNSLYAEDLIGAIRERVNSGMHYMGASAGSNVAGPTIRTTNDMPIVQPPSFEALNIFPYQINPHYVDPDPNSKHMGETREERLLQYLEDNETPVIGVREGAMLKVRDGRIWLKGQNTARIFRRSEPPRDIAAGSEIVLTLT